MERILVVNDQMELIELFRLVLDSAGYEVRTAHGGVNGLVEAKDFHPELVIVDWVMPDINGDEVVRRLRGNPDTSSIAILLMSALPEARTEAHLLGVDGFLAKPFDYETLLSGVRNALSHSRARKAA
jgi:DNA-binding response OmpR family regulator